MIDSNYIYVLQIPKGEENSYLSRVPITDTTTVDFTNCETMHLTRFGHSQTLFHDVDGEQIWTVTRKTNVGKYHWGIELGRFSFDSNYDRATNTDITPATDYTEIQRYTDLNHCGKDGKSFGAIRRVDAALSPDGHTVLLGVSRTDLKTQFAVYNLEKLSNTLTEKSAELNRNDISLENVKPISSYAISSINLKTLLKSTKDSLQGFAISNSHKYIYISSGKPDNYPKHKPAIIRIKWGHSTGIIRYTMLKGIRHAKIEAEAPILTEKTVLLGISEHTPHEKHLMYSIDKYSL